MKGTFEPKHDRLRGQWVLLTAHATGGGGVRTPLKIGEGVVCYKQNKIQVICKFLSEISNRDLDFKLSISIFGKNMGQKYPTYLQFGHTFFLIYLLWKASLSQ